MEAEDLVQLFYRHSSGLGVLVTDFELLVNRTAPRRAVDEVREGSSRLSESISDVGNRRRVFRRMSKSESTIVESGDDQRDLTDGGLNTYEGPGNQCSSVRSE